jgi:hypothetical protein
MTDDGFCECLLNTGFCSVDIVQDNGDVGHMLCSMRLYSMEPPYRCPKILQAPREWLCGNCGMANVGGAVVCAGCHGLFTSHKDPDEEDAKHRIRIHFTKQDNELREAGG